MDKRNAELYNKFTKTWYSACSRIKTLKILFSPHKWNKFNLTI